MTASPDQYVVMAVQGDYALVQTDRGGAVEELLLPFCVEDKLVLFSLL